MRARTPWPPGSRPGGCGLRGPPAQRADRRSSVRDAEELDRPGRPSCRGGPPVVATTSPVRGLCCAAGAALAVAVRAPATRALSAMAAAPSRTPVRVLPYLATSVFSFPAGGPTREGGEGQNRDDADHQHPQARPGPGPRRRSPPCSSSREWFPRRVSRAYNVSSGGARGRGCFTGWTRPSRPLTCTGQAAGPRWRPWGGWGSNPRPADYEKHGPALRTRYLHGYHGFVPLITLIAPFARVTRSTNRSTVAAPVSAHPVTVRNIAESAGLTSAANGDTVCARLDTRIECDAPNAPNMRGRQRLGEWYQ